MNRPFTSGIPAGLPVLAVALAGLSLPSFGATPVRLAGGITGLVRNGTGVPQMGATVLLFTHEDRLFGRALTDAAGKFSFPGLLPDVYSVRVSLRSFAPVFRDNIVVQPGVRSVLNVNLTTFLSSIQLVTPPPGERALMSDDWKWVLRSASETRPVLRLLPNFDPDPASHERRATAVFSETRGLVKLSGGEGGQGSGSGTATDLGTAFAFATSLFGANQVGVSGNIGYIPQTGMASAGFRTSYQRTLGTVSPVVSLTMRELVLPRMTMALSGSPAPDLPALRTMSLNFGDSTRISDALSLEYGFSLDSVSFLDRLHYFSPYSRLVYTLPGLGKIDFSYTSGNSRPDLGENAAVADTSLQRDINALAQIPRLSLREGSAKVQRGEDIELGYTRKAGSRTFRVAGYREHVTNAALNIVAPGGFYSSSDVLPDLFSSAAVFDAGDYRTLGYSTSVTQRLGDNFSATVMYGSVGVLKPQTNELTTADPEELRSIIHAGHRNAVTARASGSIPKCGTHFIASYQWVDQRSATPGHLYSTDPMRPEPGLNIYVRQPIPTFFSMPWRMEATADLRNLLAQGYLPIATPDRGSLLLVENPRCVRGGLSFIF